jgi:tetratricopeptide (TPR) repeat protein
MRSPLLAILTIVVALVPLGAEAKWTQIRSANFTFVGDAPEGAIRRIAQRLEQFREVMLRALPNATAASPVPTVVMVFANQRALQPVAPLFRGNPIEVGGYFQAGEDLNYIAIDAEYVDLALLTIFHEYAHFLVSNSMGPLPVWASEGLAEVYEMVEERDGGKKAVLGRAPQHHVELLKASTLIPIRDLLAIDQTSSVYNEGNRRGVLYAQSWALVHYVTFGNAERAKQFTQFLSSVRGGSPASSAFSAAFGDPAVLDRELFDYVRKYLFPAILLDFGERVAGGSVEKGQTLPDLDATIYVADLQGRVGREEESRMRLAAVLKQNPKAGRAHAAIGLQHFRANQMDKAMPILEQAASMGTGDGWIQNAYGRALIAQLNAAENAASIQKAHEVLGRAVELDANSAFAAAMLGYVELMLNNDPTRAASLLERAARLAPSREQYRLFLAQAYVRQRDFTKATNQLGPLVASGRDPQIRSQAREWLGRVAEMKARPPAAAAATAPTAEDLAALASLSRAGTAGSPISPPGTRRPAPTFRPDLRPVAEGETRIRGQFTAVECNAGSVVLIVQAETGQLRLLTRQLSDVDFISYRTETPGSVSCGKQPTPPWVLATYRAATAGTGPSATAGDVVAIELLPDGYEP